MHYAILSSLTTMPFIKTFNLFCSIVDTVMFDMEIGKLSDVLDLYIVYAGQIIEDFSHFENENYKRVSVRVFRRICKGCSHYDMFQKILKHIPPHITFLELIFSELDNDVSFDFPEHIKFLRISLPHRSPEEELSIPEYFFFDKLPLTLEGLSLNYFAPINNLPPMLRFIQVDTNPQKHICDYVSSLFHKMPSLEKFYFLAKNRMFIHAISGFEIEPCRHEPYFYFYRRK